MDPILDGIGSTGGVRSNTSITCLSYLIPLFSFTKLCTDICVMYQIQLIIEAHACNPFQTEIAALFPLVVLLE